MDAQSLGIASVVVNLLFGGFMWFMQETIKDLKQSDKELRAEVAHVKEHYFRREDFREFKEELWGRLDKMEGSIHELRQQ